MAGGEPAETSEEEPTVKAGSEPDRGHDFDREEEALRRRGELAKMLDEITPITEHMVTILNYLEVVATAYLYHVADHKIIHTNFKKTYCEWYELLYGFVQEFSQRPNFQPWPYVKDLYDVFTSNRPATPNPPTLPGGLPGRRRLR